MLNVFCAIMILGTPSYHSPFESDSGGINDAGCELKPVFKNSQWLRASNVLLTKTGVVASVIFLLSL